MRELNIQMIPAYSPQARSRSESSFRTRWRSTLAGCRVTVYEHLDGTLSFGYGVREAGRYSLEGTPLRRQASNEAKKAVKRHSARVFEAGGHTS